MQEKIAPVKDEQTVTTRGERVKALIDGVVLHPLLTHEDHRGDLTELYSDVHRVSDEPIVYIYQASIRPGMTKAWLVHQHQEDRICAVAGFMRWALYDDRADSPTYRQLDIFTISERNRAILRIPRGVWHGVQNIGQDEAIFVNTPTAPYNHENPDKLRLPLKNDLIPFDFSDFPQR